MENEFEKAMVYVETLKNAIANCSEEIAKDTTSDSMRRYYEGYRAAFEIILTMNGMN